MSSMRRKGYRVVITVVLSLLAFWKGWHAGTPRAAFWWTLFASGWLSDAVRHFGDWLAAYKTRQDAFKMMDEALRTKFHD